MESSVSAIRQKTGKVFDLSPFTIFYKGTADDGSTSISVAENDTVVTQLKPELLQVMLDGLKEQAPYMVIKESEMRSMEGTPVFYLRTICH